MPSAYETAERKMKADNFADETLTKLHLCEDLERKLKATAGKIPAIELLAEIVDDYRNRGIIPPATGAAAHSPQQPSVMYPPAAMAQQLAAAGPNVIENVLDDAVLLVRSSLQDDRLTEADSETIKVAGNRNGTATITATVREPRSCPLVLFSRVDARAFKLVASVSVDRFSEELQFGVSDLRGVAIHDLRQDGAHLWDGVAEPMLPRQRVDLELWVAGNRLHATVNGHDAELRRGFALQTLQQPVFGIRLPASCRLVFERLAFEPIGGGR